MQRGTNYATPLTGDIHAPGFVNSSIDVTKKAAWETTPELDALSFKAHQEQAERQAANGAQVLPWVGVTTQAATPVNVDCLEKELMDYPDGLFARTLCSQLRVGARIGYRGPRFFHLSKNLPTAKSNPGKISENLTKEVQLGRVAGPFSIPPFPNLQVSPLGLIPKKHPKNFGRFSIYPVQSWETPSTLLLTRILTLYRM